MIVTLAMFALAIQPAIMQRQDDRQSEFVWEMFAVGAPLEEFDIVDDDGVRTVTPGEILEPARANVDYSRYLPSWLCETHPGADRVIVRRQGEVVSETLCSG